MSIYLKIRQKQLPIDRRTLKRRMGKVLKDLGYENWDLSILVTDDAETREINREYRQKDKAANVLSFSMLEGEPQPGTPAVLGDLVISAETVMREAGPLGYSDQEMLYFYLIHGLLHILGHDHERGKKEAEEQERENLRLFKFLFPDRAGG